jgi:hypothetical protein
MATAPIPMQPMMYQHAQQQPVMIQGAQHAQGVPAHGIPVHGMPVQGPAMAYGPQQMVIGNNPGVSAPNTAPPDIMGIGRTRGEMDLELLESIHNTNILEPQDIKPGDDDPSRMYLLRELDGEWTMRNRMTIDRTPCRWYLTPWGGFYAVRLED